MGRRLRRIDRLLALAELQGLNQNRLARKLGVSDQTITNWKARDIPHKEVEAIADKMGVSMGKILGRGSGQSKEDGPPGRIPVVSFVMAGSWTEASDPFEPGAADDWTYTTKDVGQSGYALRVEGDSMTASSGRTFPEGSIVIVDPRKQSPNDRQFIVAKLEGHDAVTFKQFRRDDLGRLWLQPLNPQHEPIREEFRVLGTIVQKVEDV